MRRKNRVDTDRLESIKKLHSKKPWYTSMFVRGLVIGGTLGSVITFVATTIIQAPAVLSSLRAIPNEYAQTRDQLLGSYHEDEYWEGLWTSYPEGYVDMEDMQLSDTEVKLILQSKNGVIDGVIASRSICGNFYIPKDASNEVKSKKGRLPVEALSISDHYLFNYLLVAGKISGSDTVKLTIFDIIGGKKTYFGSINVKRYGVIMEVSPDKESNIALVKPIRIAQHPSITIDEAYKELNEYCKSQK